MGGASSACTDVRPILPRNTSPFCVMVVGTDSDPSEDGPLPAPAVSLWTRS
jgi:hypothetical protein